MEVPYLCELNIPSLGNVVTFIYTTDFMAGGILKILRGRIQRAQMQRWLIPRRQIFTTSVAQLRLKKLSRPTFPW